MNHYGAYSQRVLASCISVSLSVSALKDLTWDSLNDHPWFMGYPGQEWLEYHNSI